MSVEENDDIVMFPLSPTTSADILNDALNRFSEGYGFSISAKKDGKMGNQFKIKGKTKNYKINIEIFTKIDDGKFKMKIDPGFNTKKFYKSNPDDFDEDSNEMLYSELWNTIYRGFNFPPRFTFSNKESSSIPSTSEDEGWGDDENNDSGWGSPSVSPVSEEYSKSPEGWQNQIKHNMNDFRPVIVHQISGRKVDSIDPLRIEIPKDKGGNMLNVQRAVEYAFSNLGLEVRSKVMDDTGAYVINAFGLWGRKDKEISAKVFLAFESLEVILNVDMSTRLYFDPNIRDYDPHLYESASLVRFWDLLCDRLDIPKRDDIGIADLEVYNAKKTRLEKSRSLLVSQVQQNFDSDPTFVSQVASFTDSYEFMYRNYGDLFNIVESLIKFPISNVYRCGYRLRNPNFSELFLSFEEFDIDAQTLFPCIVSYVLVLNKMLLREITYTYKNTWVMQRDDEESRNMVNYLNIESPYFISRLKETLNEPFRMKYEDKEMVTQRDGKKKTLEYSKELFSLLSIRHTYDEDGEDTWVLIIQHFLRSPKTGFLGMFNSRSLFDLLNLVANTFERFTISSAPITAAKSAPTQEIAPKKQSTMVNCPFCKWLLSSDAEICPKCKQNLKAYWAAQDLDEDSGSGFNKALALIGSKESAQSDVLISSIDSYLDSMDTAGKEAQEKIVEDFKELWNSDESISDKILGINIDSEAVKNKYQAFIEVALSAEQTVQLNPFAYYHVSVSELYFNDLIVVFCRVKDAYSKYFAPVVLYICPFPVFNFPLQCTIDTEGKKIEWKSEGDGEVLTEIFNDPEEIIAQIMKKLYEDKSTFHFMPMKKNIIDKLEPIKGMDYFLDSIIQSKKIVHDGEVILNIGIMYQFLKCDLEDFQGFIQPAFVLKAMDLFYESIFTYINPAEDEPEELVQSEPEDLAQTEDPETNDEETDAPDDELSAMFGSAAPDEIELDGQDIEISKDAVQGSSLDNITRQEFIALCLDNDLNPKLTDIAEIDRQTNELKYQMESIKDMENQLEAAFVSNQIDFAGYNAQKQQIKEYLESFDLKIKLLHIMKTKFEWN